MDSLIIRVEDTDHHEVIGMFNTLVKSSVLKYEEGETLNYAAEALALYNIILIQPGDNVYNIDENHWNRFEAFVRNQVPSATVELTLAEKQVISSSLSTSLSYRHLANMEDELRIFRSDKTSQILKIIQNLEKMSKVSIDEEDVLIRDFIEPLLMEPFFSNIEGTIVHGNGHPMYESYFRKVKVARKYGFLQKGVVIKGRVPDRAVEFTLSENKSSLCWWSK